jgi:hypothetical protein
MGQRSVVKQLYNIFIAAAVIACYAGGKDVSITQTSQTPPEYSFTITRIQLPIRLLSLKIVKNSSKNSMFCIQDSHVLAL